jgi:hypothetical protein
VLNQRSGAGASVGATTGLVYRREGAGIVIQPLHYYIIEEARPLTPAFCCENKYGFIYRYLLCTDYANIYLDTPRLAVLAPRIFSDEC